MKVTIIISDVYDLTEIIHFMVLVEASGIIMCIMSYFTKYVIDSGKIKIAYKCA